MTQDQINELVQVGDQIRANPRPWSELDSNEQSVLKGLLLPDRSFTPLQRAYLSKWFLKVIPADVASLNELMPPRSIITSRQDLLDDHYLSADLLSDALEDGPLAALLPILENLTLTYEDQLQWPTPIEE